VRVLLGAAGVEPGEEREEAEDGDEDAEQDGDDRGECVRLRGSALEPSGVCMRRRLCLPS